MVTFLSHSTYTATKRRLLLGLSLAPVNIHHGSKGSRSSSREHIVGTRGCRGSARICEYLASRQTCLGEEILGKGTIEVAG